MINLLAQVKLIKHDSIWAISFGKKKFLLRGLYLNDSLDDFSFEFNTSLIIFSISAGPEWKYCPVHQAMAF